MCFAINLMPRLLAMDLSGTKVGDLFLHRLIETQFETLRELSLSKVQFSDDTGKLIGALTNLQHLNLSSCSSLTEKTFQELSNLEGMEILNLQDTQISSIDLIAAMARMQRLVSLNVCACGELSGRIIPHFPSSLRRMLISQTKILAGLYHHGEHPSEIFPRLPRLEVFSAEYMDDFHDLSCLSSLAPQLRELRIPYNGLSDLTSRVLESMDSLEILDVAGCDAIGDVTAGRAAKLPKLLSLDMSATQITNEGIKRLTRGTGPLQSVELYNCEFIHNQDGAVDALREALQRKGGLGVWWDYGEISDESAHEEDGDYIFDEEHSAGELRLDSQDDAVAQV
jgi:Leucine-rich repeat (LRR) protein